MWAPMLPVCEADLDALARFDLWLCRARFADELGAVRPERTDRPVITLLSARHPGLSGRVVPIDVRLGGEYTALVITGPNTGGKTVALRTVGLLVLMNQAGLHVPVAEGSALPVFSDVLADIGDEQSVAQSLSTFSGHLRTITRIVGAAGAATLVLLDELGAGTDPTEGSALAQALLDHFIRVGALVVATTHYAELKTYAHNETRARNASVDFDLATLAPTFHLSIGLPGTSQAFAIAERLGLPQALVEDARSRLTVAQQEFETTLASIRQSQRTIVASEARAAEAEARALARQGRGRGGAPPRPRRTAGGGRGGPPPGGGRTGRRRGGDRGDARRPGAGRPSPRLASSRPWLASTQRTALLPRIEEPRAGDDASAAPLSRSWRVGQRAATAGGWLGTVAALDAERGRASLEVGGMRVEVAMAELLPASATGPALSGSAIGRAGTAPRSGRRGDYGEAKQSTSGSSAVQAPREPTPVGARQPVRAIAASLDLRGARVEEALELLDRYLDGASRARRGACHDRPRPRLGRHAGRRAPRPRGAPPGAGLASR